MVGSCVVFVSVWRMAGAGAVSVSCACTGSTVAVASPHRTRRTRARACVSECACVRVCVLVYFSIKSNFDPRSITCKCWRSPRSKAKQILKQINKTLQGYSRNVFVCALCLGPTLGQARQPKSLASLCGHVRQRGVLCCPVVEGLADGAVAVRLVCLVSADSCGTWPNVI